MAWIWHNPQEDASWGADFDDEQSGEITELEFLADAPVDPALGVPVYKSRSKLQRFTRLHCPPFGGVQVVDSEWQRIILEFVPSDRVQFYPVRLVARGETYDGFSWLIPFDRVRCIDVMRSRIFSKIEKPGITLVYDCDEYVHIDGCLGSKHLARDEQKTSHMLLSDELKNALAATGEHSMFYLPENVPTMFGKNGLLKRA